MQLSERSAQCGYSTYGDSACNSAPNQDSAEIYYRYCDGRAQLLLLVIEKRTW